MKRAWICGLLLALALMLLAGPALSGSGEATKGKCFTGCIQAALAQPGKHNVKEIGNQCRSQCGFAQRSLVPCVQTALYEEEECVARKCLPIVLVSSQMGCVKKCGEEAENKLKGCP